MTNAIMIMAEYIPRLMQLKEEAEAAIKDYDGEIQFRLTRNLYTAGLFFEDGHTEYLYVILADLPEKRKMQSFLLQIKAYYPRANIVGIQGSENSQDTLKKGHYVYQKGGMKVGTIRVIEEQQLRGFLKQELPTFPDLIEQLNIYRQEEQKKKMEEIRNEQERIFKGNCK